MPASGLSHAAGPCNYQPAAQRSNVKTHLMKRHGRTTEEAAALVDALVPVERTGEAVDAEMEDAAGAAGAGAKQR